MVNSSYTTSHDLNRTGEYCEDRSGNSSYKSNVNILLKQNIIQLRADSKHINYRMDEESLEIFHVFIMRIKAVAIIKNEATKIRIKTNI